MRISNRIPRLPARPRDAHKGDFGRILIIAGSLRMPGAAWLAGQAAARAGGGLVTIAAPEAAIAALASRVTVQTLLPLASSRRGIVKKRAVRTILASAGGFDIVAMGPGLTVEEEAPEFIEATVRALELPLVLDADGLNAFAERVSEIAARRAPTVVTPHPGEAARLAGVSIQQIQNARAAAASELAMRTRAVVVLKGNRTVVASAAATYVNKTGNPGMATGGAGDVLTGALAALLARARSPFEAAVAAVYTHGLAGDLAAAKLGEEGLIATDILDYLPQALHSLRNK